jgi:tripartite-type tricarboxylate transporter receptor subunit TctC
LPYDALKDFEPVSQVALSSSVLAVAPTFPASNVSELVAKLKAEPEKHSYGSYGVGTTSNIYGELFKRETGVAMAHVPYKGAAPVVNDLLAGVVNIGFVDVGTAIQHIKAGKLKPLAIIGTRRSSQLPEVPTFQELGFKGFEPYAWMGLLAPAGTPRPVIDAMAAEVRRIVRLPDVQARMRDASLEPVGNSPAEFSAVLRTDSETWKRVILASGITLE